MDNVSRPTRNPVVRTGFLVAGGVLILVTPVVALLPAPVGVFTFAGGLALILPNSLWARRQFVRGKRRYPRLGGLADRSLRRPSARRRRERDALR